MHTLRLLIRVSRHPCDGINLMYKTDLLVECALWRMWGVGESGGCTRHVP